MKRLIVIAFAISTILVSPLAFPLSAFADTYGSSSYGGGGYGAQSTSSSNIVSSVTNAVSAFFCTNQAPSSAPNLYEIDVTSATAKLFFAPAGGPYDQHYISYGLGNNSEGYGIDFSTSQSTGADYYTISQLSPRTVYTFKVRGGNGCKPGPWSNTLTIHTLVRGSKATKKFYPNSQAQYVQVSAPSWWTRAGNYISNLMPSAPNTVLGPAKQHSKPAVLSTPQSSKTSSHASWWGSFTSDFSGIFHAL